MNSLFYTCFASRLTGLLGTEQANSGANTLLQVVYFADYKALTYLRLLFLRWFRHLNDVVSLALILLL